MLKSLTTAPSHQGLAGVGAWDPRSPRHTPAPADCQADCAVGCGACWRMYRGWGCRILCWVYAGFVTDLRRILPHGHYAWDVSRKPFCVCLGCGARITLGCNFILFKVIKTSGRLTQFAMNKFLPHSFKYLKPQTCSTAIAASDQAKNRNFGLENLRRALKKTTQPTT